MDKLNSGLELLSCVARKIVNVESKSLSMNCVSPVTVLILPVHSSRQ